MSPYAPKTSPRPPPRPDDLGKSKPPNTTSGDSANEGGGRGSPTTSTINDYAQVGLGAFQDTIENRSTLNAARDAGRILDGGAAMLDAAEDGDIDFYDIGKVGGAVRGGIPGSTVSAVAEIAEAVDDGYEVGITGGILGGIGGGILGGAGGTMLSPGAGNAAGTVAGVAIGESLGRKAEIALVGGIARERQRNAERLEDNPAKEFTMDGVSQAIDDYENSIRSRLGLPFQPLIVDLDRDGPEIMSQDGSSAFFDMDGDGFIEQTAWVGPGDGFLTIDLSTSGAKKPDGRITHAREFAFANFTSAEDTDLQAFRAKYDSNKDGRFNKSDSAWSLARIWRDKDLDGVSDPGEVRSLSSYGISEVRLAHRGASISDRSNDVRFEGSTVHGTGDIVRNGKTQAHGFADVTLAKTSAGVRTQDIGNGLLTEFEGPKGPKILRMEGNGSSSVDMKTSDLDFVLGDHRHNTLTASSATSAVIMNGEGGNDKLYGSKYSDVLNGGVGSNKLYGNAGNDIIFFQQGDYVRGGSGYDTGVLITTVTFKVDLVELQLEGLNGAHGNDLVRASNSKHGYVIFGGGGNDDVSLSKGRDYVDAGSGNDLVRTNAGNDEIRGGSGHDKLYGGSGADKLYGGSGNDVIVGGTGRDTMRGEAGNDTIYAGSRSEDKFTWDSGGDPIDMGGSGYDRLIMNPGAQFKTKSLSSYGFEEFRGAEKDDSVWTSKNSTTGVYLDGGSGNDDLRGGRGPDELRGSHGSDILYGRGGRDDLRGQGGRDQFNFKNDYGRDVIWDFQNNLDTIRLDDDLRGLRDGNHSYNLGKVGDLARRSGNDLVLDFGEDELVIKNTTWAAVIDDIVFSS